jgi:hypothetical protein
VKAVTGTVPIVTGDPVGAANARRVSCTFTHSGMKTTPDTSI